MSEDVEEVHAAVLEQQDEKKSVNLDRDANDIQENMADVFVLANIESEDIQISSEKTKGNKFNSIFCKAIIL